MVAKTPPSSISRCELGDTENDQYMRRKEVKEQNARKDERRTRMKAKTEESAIGKQMMDENEEAELGDCGGETTVIKHMSVCNQWSR